MIGFATLRLWENGDIRINPDEVVKIVDRDSYRPGSGCIVHMKDGTRHTIWHSAEEAQLKIEAMLS